MAAAAGVEGRRAAVVASCRILAAAGHGHLCFGHVSARCGEGFAVKVAGVGLEEVGPEEVAIVTGADRRPADAPMHDELPIHEQIYRARPEVGGVVHTHPPAAVLVSHRPDLLAALDQDSLLSAAEIGSADFPGLLVDAASGARLAADLGAHRVLLLRGHGIVAVGADLEEATVNAVLAERSCAAAVAARAAGIESSIGAAEAEALRATMVDTAASRKRAIWAYLERRIRS